LTEKTDQTEKPENTQIIEFSMSSLSDSFDRPEVVEAVRLSLPTAHGMRNAKLRELARRLKGIDGIRDQDAEELEPIVREWFRLALPSITTQDWSTSWGEWLYIWPWTTTSICDETVYKAWRSSVSKPIPPVPDTYKSKHLRSLVALCAAMHETATDTDGVWFISCRKATAILGLVDTQHDLGEHKRGSRMSQRYRYLGYKLYERTETTAA
jgi:hypothetical protein